MSTERTRYLMIQHAGSFKLCRLIDTGNSLLLQTPKREAEGLPPRYWCQYGSNDLPADLNASIVHALLNLKYAPKVDQSVAAKIFARETLKRTQQLAGQVDLLKSGKAPIEFESQHDKALKMRDQIKARLNAGREARLTRGKA